MSNKPTAQASASGVGFFGLLTILFIALKLFGVIGWSWWWVLAPLWLPVALFLGIAVVGFIIWFCVELAKTGKKAR